MITLQTIGETNFLDAAGLKVHPAQRGFVASAPMILARAYACRNQRSKVWGIYSGAKMVGLAMIHDLEEEPACYHLCEFMVDACEQGKGYGRQALDLILSECRREDKFPRVEVCVKRENSAAIHVYEKAGFRNTGYQDPDAPDSLCMAYEIQQNFTTQIQIRRTGREDLPNVQALWANPAVMRFVGFPEGLHETLEYLENDWLPWAQNPPKRQHYSVYADALATAVKASTAWMKRDLPAWISSCFPVPGEKGLPMPRFPLRWNRHSAQAVPGVPMWIRPRRMKRRCACMPVWDSWMPNGLRVWVIRDVLTCTWK